MPEKFGTLYIVATPIGNLQDISFRALEILKHVDLIAAEDTRHSKILLQHYSINTPMISLHDYNEKERSDFLVEQLKTSKSIALISDAGTPLINDPGYHLVKTVRDNKIKTVPIPGPCAAIAALSSAGLPTDRFTFEGFLPVKKTQRLNRLNELAHEIRTMIFYESPRRLKDTLADMCKIFGTDRVAVIAHELTKIYETIESGELKNLIDSIKDKELKGEFVILVSGKNEKIDNQLVDIEAEKIFKILNEELPRSQAAKLTAKIIGKKLSKKEIYNIN